MCDEKWIYYRNPDASKQWLGPCQQAKVTVKKTVGPKVMFVSGGILKVWFTGSLFQTDVQSMRIVILNNWCEFMTFWDGDTQH